MFGGNDCASIPLVAPIGTNNGCCNGNDNAFGGMGSWWVIIILFALIFGWNGRGGNDGNGGNGGMQYIPYAIGNSYTDSAVQRGFDNQSVINKLNGLENGLCDGFYAQNTNLLNGFASVQQTLCQGFSGVNASINQTGNAIQRDIQANTVAGMQNTNALQAQLADCCCKNTMGQADIKYQLATDTCAVTTAISNAARDITDNQNANYRALHDEIVANRIEDKNTQIAALNQKLFEARLDASQVAQNQYLTNQIRPCPVPAYITCNPWGCNSPVPVTLSGNQCDCNRVCMG